MAIDRTAGQLVMIGNGLRVWEDSPSLRTAPFRSAWESSPNTEN
jgi:hypothetical protein